MLPGPGSRATYEIVRSYGVPRESSHTAVGDAPAVTDEGRAGTGGEDGAGVMSAEVAAVTTAAATPAIAPIHQGADCDGC